MTSFRPKLIEVALPLATINREAAREKSIRHGHPSTLHLWWARRPLAATRAVIWASLVDDPSGDETLTPAEQEAERQRLFGILERLVVWENSNNPEVLAEAKAEIDRCFPDGAPPVLDPFGGGGAIPLEAQRLGLKALSGDLNPVAVLIQKGMLEIPPRFAGRRPVHPDVDTELKTWERAQGLAADVEAYGRWMRDEAHKRIGHLYPDVEGPDGEQLTPIAWIWARTVESPDPSWSGHVPLVASWVLRNKKGKPKVWIEPIINRDTQTITYEIREGGEPTRAGTYKGGNGTCIATGAAIPGKYIKAKGQDRVLGEHLLAVIAEGPKGRIYCKPGTVDHTKPDSPTKLPEQALPDKALGFRVQAYGFTHWKDLFNPRQLTAITTFSDLLLEVAELVEFEAVKVGLAGDGVRLRDDGSGARAYADAVITYLAFAIDRCIARWTHLAIWNSVGEKLEHAFRLNALQMNMVHAEGNPFSSSTGNWSAMVAWVMKALKHLPALAGGDVVQRDARTRLGEGIGAVVSTDPPYYDNMAYADLSDFFYVWMRRNLSDVWPDECATLLTPKADELIANPYRAGSKEAAEEYFEDGMAEFMSEMSRHHHPEVPSTIFYAYKATETKDGETRSTGWDTFLSAVLDARLQVTATWPVRTERQGGQRAVGRNALASSIVLACRPRDLTAPLASRGEFVAALWADLPDAVRVLQSGNIAPVDLPQSTIGPGIKVFSRYAKVVEADGSAMSVGDALAIINDVLGEILDGDEAELDSYTRFALTWYAEHGWNPGPAGAAMSLAQAKNTSLAGAEAAGVGEARGGEFRLFERYELDTDWTPAGDDTLTVWEATQYLVAALRRSESEAADLLKSLGGYGERARTLAYILFQKATDQGLADEAGAYNDLITAWPTLKAAAATADTGQQTLI